MPRHERSSSQVGVSGAMRSRDVSRPRPADVAAAEEIVQSVVAQSRRQQRQRTDRGRSGGQPDGTSRERS
ncbi:MAG TPA: hypothetical protein VFT62_04225 [Mycobacteriales bacterium]|nr:hypothetical protein [Mycobacteriales bacterium]